tara:strand:- start:195 stop:899 length:705 start_codon:yes stop_codon:yes gene_type:complete
MKIDPNQMKAVKIPLVNRFEFMTLVNESNIDNICEDKSRNVRLNIWEARNPVTYRLKIKDKDGENIEKCAYAIVDLLQVEKVKQTQTVKKIVDFEKKMFEESIVDLMSSVDFRKFQKLIDKDFLLRNNNEDLKKKEILDLLQRKILNSNTIYLSDVVIDPEKPIKNNFLTGYVYNYIDNFITFKNITTMTDAKIEFQSSKNFKRENLFKMSLTIFIIYVLSIIFNNRNLILKKN